jgi:8-oxo-dGTP diphosphatase
MMAESKPIITVEQSPIRAASACVFRDGKVLLIKRREGMWAFPGGKLLEQETPFDGAHRELFEETGVTADLQQLVGQYEVHARHGHFLISCYTGFHLAGEGLAMSDAQDAQWFLPSETRVILLAVHVQSAIMSAQRLLTF